MRMKRTRSLLPMVLAAALLGLPAVAAAGTATTTTTGTATTGTTAVTPKPEPKPSSGSARLYLSGLFSVRSAPVTVPGRGVAVTGVVRPYVAGQAVLLKAYVDGRLFKVVKLALAPSRSHVYGRFADTVAAPAAGAVTVTVLHGANTLQKRFTARAGWSALDENVGFGSTGRFVVLLQQRLAALHFYIPQTGVYDAGTGLAVDAYHRLLGWGVAQTVGPALVGDLLSGVGAFHVRYPGQGRHAEGDLSDQLLALVNGSQVQLIFPISSGKPSTPTILGIYRVYERTPGYLPDGMYYSDFFIRGYAIHGYDPAPDYPASHGCMRLPIADAITAYNWLAIGDWVDSYYT